MMAERIGDLVAALTRLTRGRNPWEKGPVARLLEPIGERISHFTGQVADAITVYHRPLSWAFCTILLGSTVAASVLISTSFLGWREEISTQTHLQKRAPDPAQIQKQLEAAILSGDFPQARLRLEELSAIWPNDARMYQAKGALLMVDERDFATAREEFLKALELRPNDTELLFNLAEAEFNLGRYKEAESHYERLAFGQSRGDLIRFRLYLCALQQGKQEKAASVAESASVSFQSPAWFFIKSVEARRRGNALEARKLIESARLMHGDRTRIFDQTLTRLNLDP